MTLAKLAGACVLLGAPAMSQSSFIALGPLPGPPSCYYSAGLDLSSDGRTVVGQATGLIGSVETDVPFRWRESTGIIQLELPLSAFRGNLHAVSPDGVRAGGSFDTNMPVASRSYGWTPAGGGAPFAPFGQVSNGIEITTVAIAIGGQAAIGIPLAGPVRWSASTGSTPIGGSPTTFVLDADETCTRAVGIMPTGTGGLEAFIWDEAQGFTLLGKPPGTFQSRATAISADGEVVVGHGLEPNGTVYRGFIWTAAGGMVGLGPGGTFIESRPVDVSRDGNVILMFNSQQFWTPQAGIRELRDVLIAGGAVFPADDSGFPLDVRAVSDDGNAFVGSYGGSCSAPHAFVCYLEPPVSREVGASVCSPAAANSTGGPGALVARGSAVAQDNDLFLQANSLPPSTFCLLLNSMQTGFVPNLGGGDGDLCLAGAIGRHSAAVAPSTAAGTLELALDLGATPTPNALVSVLSGQSWTFQLWYRDLNPSPTSNLTNAVTVDFH